MREGTQLVEVNAIWRCYDMAFGLSTENARKWSRKGKSLQSKVLRASRKSRQKGE
jgi:hypothetical protein